MKTYGLIIIVVAIAAAITSVIVLSTSFDVTDNYFYPENLKLKWTDDKLIQDSDVITLGQLVSYDNNEWRIETFYITIKGNVEESIINVKESFSGSTTIIPQINQTYIWFLTKDGNEYFLTANNGIVDANYDYAIQQAIAKPTVQNSIENKKINLSDPTVPKTQDGLIDYHQLIMNVSKPLFVELFAQIGKSVQEDNIVLMMGPWPAIYTEYSSVCGYTIVDDSVYWLQSELKQDTLTKASIMTENPDPCKPGYFSCFCMAQYQMTEDTVTELSYFDEEEEAYVGHTFQDFLNEGYKVTNMPKKFVVGDHNFELQPDDTTFCGSFVTDKQRNFGPDRVIREDVIAFRYFSGIIKNNEVIFWGLEEPMRLCAINPDARIYDFK
ncbi:MAG: hypothetical protein ACREAL_09310 [Nitrosopumilaceae archaeon]